MKIHHLTFGQLYRLLAPQNIIRVSAAYHSQLATAWGQLGTKEFFTVSSAEHRFPDITRRYKPVLDFIQKDSAAKFQLRKLADEQQVPHIPDAHVLYRRAFEHTYSSQTQPDKYARCHAELELHHANECGVPGVIEHESGTYGVYLDTNEMGIQTLYLKSGLLVKEAVRFCWSRGCQPRVFFYWLPVEFEDENGLDYYGGYKIHPSVKPVNSADGRRHCEENNYYLNK